MLLDKYTLTKSLASLPTASSHLPLNSPAHTNFTKRLTTTLSRLDPLLKTLQVRPSPAEGLVQAYLIHISDRSEANFRKILDLKGVRKADQPALVELFNIHKEVKGKMNGELLPMSPLLSPLMNGNSGTSVGSGIGIGGTGLGITSVASSALPGLPNMQTRFDAAGFGEKLFSAARDGVERMGSTGGAVVGGVGERVGSPLSEDAKSLESNLKSIGKFFRRDVSGFGVGRFGTKREGSVDDSTR